MKYKRVLLKLSGEALIGDQEYGSDSKRLSQYADEIENFFKSKKKIYNKDENRNK